MKKRVALSIALALAGCERPIAAVDPREQARVRAEGAILGAAAIAASSVIVRECDIGPGFANPSADRRVAEVALGGVWQPSRLERIESHVGIGVFSRARTRETGVDDAERQYARSAPFLVHLNRADLVAPHPTVTCDGESVQGRLWFHAEIDLAEVLDTLELDEDELKEHIDSELPEGSPLHPRDLLSELDALPPAP